MANASRPSQSEMVRFIVLLLGSGANELPACSKKLIGISTSGNARCPAKDVCGAKVAAESPSPDYSLQAAIPAQPKLNQSTTQYKLRNLGAPAMTTERLDADEPNSFWLKDKGVRGSIGSIPIEST